MLLNVKSQKGQLDPVANRHSNQPLTVKIVLVCLKHKKNICIANTRLTPITAKKSLPLGVLAMKIPRLWPLLKVLRNLKDKQFNEKSLNNPTESDTYQERQEPLTTLGRTHGQTTTRPSGTGRKRHCYLRLGEGVALKRSSRHQDREQTSSRSHRPIS